jgi:hypothetical protein
MAEYRQNERCAECFIQKSEKQENVRNEDICFVAILKRFSS